MTHNISLGNESTSHSVQPDGCSPASSQLRKRDPSTTYRDRATTSMDQEQSKHHHARVGMRKQRDTASVETKVKEKSDILRMKRSVQEESSG